MQKNILILSLLAFPAAVMAEQCVFPVTGNFTCYERENFDEDFDVPKFQLGIKMRQLPFMQPGVDFEYRGGMMGLIEHQITLPLRSIETSMNNDIRKWLEESAANSDLLYKGSSSFTYSHGLQCNSNVVYSKSYIVDGYGSHYTNEAREIFEANGDKKMNIRTKIDYFIAQSGKHHKSEEYTRYCIRTR